MKILNLFLMAVLAVLLTTTMAMASSWTESTDATVSGGLYETNYTTITNLDTDTDQLTVDACSAIEIVFDPSVAVTATIVAQMDSAGTVSQTVVNSSGNIAISGTTVTIPAGAIKIYADIGVTVSPATVNMAVVERKYINCQTDYLR